MITVFVHHDPIARGSFELAVRVLDAAGQMLDVPEIVDVLGSVLYSGAEQIGPRAKRRLLYCDGTLSSAAGADLARGYWSRIRVEPELRRWLMAEAFVKVVERDANPTDRAFMARLAATWMGCDAC